jgi:hypothetical protein
MYPVADIVLSSQLPPSSEFEFWTPETDEIDEYEGFGCFRDVWAITGITTREAIEVFRQDKLLCRVVSDLASDAIEFDVLAAAAESGSTDEIDVISSGHLAALARYMTGEATLEGLEAGVAGLVYSLSAAGMYPAASCRGHPGPDRWSPFPVVMFAASRPRAEALQPLVENSGCGFAVDPLRPELLAINARSVQDTLRLATAVLGSTRIFNLLR